MLHRCDVENCEDTSATMVEKAEKSKRKDERIAWPERQMMLATRIILYIIIYNIPAISIHYFLKDVAV